MNIIPEGCYIPEKQAFINLLIDSRMLEITYSETFSLMFYKAINISENDNYKWTYRKMNLIIDAPFWVGEKSKWEEHIKDDNNIIAMDDNVLAYELVNIRQNNLIQDHKVEFFEKYVCISLDNEKILSIAHYGDSDYSWILEEYNDKNDQEKIMIFCQGNEIIAKNIPETL